MPAAMLPPEKSTVPSDWFPVTAAGDSPAVAWSGAFSAWTSTMLDKNTLAIKDVSDLRILDSPKVVAAA